MESELAIVDTQQTSLTALPENLQQRIMAASLRLKESSAVQVNKIRNDAKNFVMPDGDEADSFTGIIVAAKHANMHYASAYAEGITNPPDCLAIMDGSDDSSNVDLTPQKLVTSPYSGNCGSCSKLQWGSDKGGKGKGKACAEYVMLAIAVPSLGDDLFLLECKKGNARVVDNYLANVTNKHGHPIVVNTTFSMGIKNKWAQSFLAKSPVSDELVASLAGRIDEANAMLVERVKGAYQKAAVAANDTKTTDTSSGRAARAR